jgi:hypothetical protein
MKILIKYASRQRPIAFMRGIHSITNTIHAKNYQILVTADIDDTTMNCDDIKRELAYFPHVKIIYGKSESKVNAINRDMEQADPFDLLINFSDDMKFVKEGWDDIMIHEHKKRWQNSTDFFAHWNDGYVGNSLPTMSIMGYDYYKRDNYIYYPEYKSFSCDSEAYYVAIARDRYYYFPEVLFHHEHPANNTKILNDDLYRVNSLHTPHDVKLYFNRLHRDFDLKLPEGTYKAWDWAKKQYDFNGNKL